MVKMDIDNDNTERCAQDIKEEIQEIQPQEFSFNLNMKELTNEQAALELNQILHLRLRK
jgi:CII-binding regulator of phage lambda lysogenization HflD